jgi:hypothetical protein
MINNKKGPIIIGITDKFKQDQPTFELNDIRHKYRVSSNPAPGKKL